MSGLGLNQAVDAYVQGRGQQEKLRQMDAQRAEEAVLAEADAAYGAVHQQAQARALSMNPTAEYKPTDEIEFEAAEARGKALAKAGKWKHYLDNEALVAKQRLRVRGEALQQYKLDGDPETLVRRVYPTIFDGRKVVGTERIQGAEEVQGLKAIPESIKITFSDGKTAIKPIAELVAELNKTMMDPATFAEAEVKNNFARELIENRGEQARATEGVKAEGRQAVEKEKGRVRLEVEDVKLGGKREEIAGREKVAGINKEARLGAAGTAAGASNYRADRGVDAAGVRAGATLGAATVRAGTSGAGGKKPDPINDFNTVHNEIRKMVGDPSQGIMGGSKMHSEQTLKIARVAEAAMKSGVEYSAAMQGAIDAHKRRQGAEKPKQ
jgi:hypothetical protein